MCPIMGSGPRSVLGANIDKYEMKLHNNNLKTEKWRLVLTRSAGVTGGTVARANSC